MRHKLAVNPNKVTLPRKAHLEIGGVARMLFYMVTLIGFSFLVPLRFLLCLFPITILFPSGQLPLNAQIQSAYPALLVGFVIAIRKMLNSKGNFFFLRDRSQYIFSAFGLFFVVISIAIVNKFNVSSIVYFFSIILMFYFLPFITLDNREYDLLSKSWRFLILITAVYSIFEVALQRNILLGGFFERGINPISSSLWSTYRATSFVGHPLLLCLFMSVSAVFYLSRFIEKQKYLDFVSFCLALVSSLLTVSRYVLPLLLIFISYLLVLQTIKKRAEHGKIRNGKNFGLTYLATFFIFVAAVPLFQEVIRAFFLRADSSEGLYSGIVRIHSLSKALDSDLFSVFGSNTGFILDVFSRGVGAGYGLENSILQIVGSLGFLGSGLFFIYIFSLIKTKQNFVFSRAPLYLYLFSLPFFNFFDGYRSTHAFFVMIFLLCRGPIYGEDFEARFHEKKMKTVLKTA
jgi:hypothetical protein